MVHSDAIRLLFSKVGTPENIWNKGRCMVHCDAVSNDVLEVWTAENFKSKYTKWCILSLLETIFSKLDLLRKCWNEGRCMVHSGAIWNDALEVGTAEKTLKARKLVDAFGRYLKRWFGSWDCLEQFETKEAKWCIRTLFEECGRRLSGELLNVEICSSLK